MENMPPIVGQTLEKVQPVIDLALAWATSPAAWSQFVLLIVAFVLAWLVTRKLSPFFTRLLTPETDSTTILSKVRRFVLMFLPLLLPLLAFVFLSIGEQVTRSAFGSGEIVAFGKRVFLFLAVRAFVRDIVTDPFLKLLGRYVAIPVAALYTVGLLEPVTAQLDAIIVPLGNLSFSVLWLLRFAILGGVIFWLGRWSNDQSSTYIKAQEMRPATRELAAKAVEILIFGVAFLLLMNIMGVPMTSLAVLTGALGVGIGFGLQKIASNFISGVILLLEGQATVGDYVELDGGEAGRIVKMTARAAILETFDGRWIVVPNEDFIVTRVINYSDQGSANRYEAEFSVSYDTDINLIPDMIATAVAKHPDVLQKPEPPDVELRGFGDSGIDFAVEFWVNGIDDGKNKYTSDVLFIIWNTLRDNNIQIPYPHRVIEMRTPATDDA
jgi:small-conductance mechanosensitive channel